MQKRVWITSMAKDQARTTSLLTLAKKYGLAPDGHFWVDDLEKMAWQSPLEHLLAKETTLWVILANKKDLETDSIRYGLTLLAISLQSGKGIGFPIVFATFDKALEEVDLPTPFKGAEVFPADHPSLGAKLTARANTPVKKVQPDYRLDIHANQGYGIWFELGPAKGETWNGVMAGGLTSLINAHGVGPAGELPLKTTLEYQMQGLTLNLGEEEYTAWAVKNSIDDTLSYYVRFAGNPGSILFGRLPYDAEEADFHSMILA